MHSQVEDMSESIYLRKEELVVSDDEIPNV